MFAHPRDIRRASDYALMLGQDIHYLRTHPGEVYCYLAHAHPFLDGNGRTILTIHDELCRRAGFHVLWHNIGTREFLKSLTDDLLQPAAGQMDALVSKFAFDGALPLNTSMLHLKANFDRSR